MKRTKEMYSEVYSILNLLGDNFINKLPKQLYSLIQNEKSDTYNPIYNTIDNLKNQNIQKESLSMISLLHLNYWCNDEKEKKDLEAFFKRNYDKHQTELKEKYDVNNLFKKKTDNNIIVNNDASSKSIEASKMSTPKFKTTNIFSNNNSMIKYKKESFISKFINKIKTLIERIHYRTPKKNNKEIKNEQKQEKVEQPESIEQEQEPSNSKTDRQVWLEEHIKSEEENLQILTDAIKSAKVSGMEESEQKLIKSTTDRINRFKYELNALQANNKITDQQINNDQSESLEQIQETKEIKNEQLKDDNLVTLPNGARIPRKQYEQEYLPEIDKQKKQINNIKDDFVTLPNGARIPRKQYEQEYLPEIDKQKKQINNIKDDFVTLPNGARIPRKQYEQEYLPEIDKQKKQINNIKDDLVTLPNGAKIPRKQYEQEYLPEIDKQKKQNLLNCYSKKELDTNDLNTSREYLKNSKEREENPQEQQYDESR